MILEEFKQAYQTMDATNIELIESIYSQNVIFEDPFHKVEGLINLKDYFKRLYQNIEKIEFEFSDQIEEQTGKLITWTMRLTHPKLNSGKPFLLQGATHLKINKQNKIEFHKDYFDGGAMLYEKLPIIGRIIKQIKANL